jgi:hypothetical protein
MCYQEKKPKNRMTNYPNFSGPVPFYDSCPNFLSQWGFVSLPGVFFGMANCMFATSDCDMNFCGLGVRDYDQRRLCSTVTFEPRLEGREHSSLSSKGRTCLTSFKTTRSSRGMEVEGEVREDEAGLESGIIQRDHPIIHLIFTPNKIESMRGFGAGNGLT